MSRNNSTRLGLLLCGSAIFGPALALAAPSNADPQTVDGGVNEQLLDIKAQLQAQKDRLSRQEADLAEQRRQLAEQEQAIRREADQFSELKAQREALMDSLRAAGYNVVGSASDPIGALLDSPRSSAPVQVAEAVNPGGPATSQGPVGEAPPQQPRGSIVAAVPPEVSVLTPKGHLVAEPTLDYTLTSSNVLVFRGVEIVPGVQLGVIEASNTQRAAESVTAAYRYGLLKRMEFEVRVPYLWRQDRITVVQQRDQQVTRELSLRGAGLGDVEFGTRYQINAFRPNQPVFIAGLRAKSDTGSNPYLVGRDQFGVETHLATGSGFWGLEPSLTMLYPSDPAVLFGSISYMHNFGKAFHKTIGSVVLNHVDPGESIGAAAGFGFAVNSKFSYSVAYKYNYIFPTKVNLGGSIQKSHGLQVGTVVLGLSYRLNDRVTLGGSVEIGTTSDAPDTHFTLRIPFTS